LYGLANAVGFSPGHAPIASFNSAIDQVNHRRSVFPTFVNHHCRRSDENYVEWIEVIKTILIKLKDGRVLCSKDILSLRILLDSSIVPSLLPIPSFANVVQNLLTTVPFMGHLGSEVTQVLGLLSIRLRSQCKFTLAFISDMATIGIISKAVVIEIFICTGRKRLNSLIQQ
jgi:hypothetical protein